MLANYLPKTAEQLRLEQSKRRAAIWTRYPKIKAAYDARLAWRQSAAGIEFCASRLAKLLSADTGKATAETLPIARQRIRARFANIKPSSPDRLPAGANIQRASAVASAVPLSPQVARPASVATAPATARPAVVPSKPVVTAPTAREYNEVLRLWTDKQVGKYMGGSKLKAAMDGLVSYIQSNGRNAAYVMMKQDLASK